MNKKLYLEFEDSVGEIAKIVVNDPKEDIDDETIIAQMGVMVSANVFDSKGNDLANALKAYVIEQVRTDYL